MARDEHLAPDSQWRHDAGTPTVRILIVDDEKDARTLAEGALTTVKGYEIQAADSAAAARQIAGEWLPDVVILDIWMPDMNGIALARLLRADGCDAEFMFLTSDKELETKEAGLDVADQYLTKPYSTRELLALIRVLLRNRRRHTQAPEGQPLSRPEIDALRPVFDETSDLVRIPRGKNARLTGVPKMLLLALLAGDGKPVSKCKLYKAVWMSNCDDEGSHDISPGEENLVQVNIHRLRRKIELNAAQPELIISARGGGYYYNLTP